MTPKFLVPFALLAFAAHSLGAQRLAPPVLGPAAPAARPFRYQPVAGIASPDSTGKRPTYWLDVGLVGAFLGSFVGLIDCRLHEAAGSCRPALVIGATVGFTVGALIGSQLHRPQP
jgi:hypothetical protein